MAIDKSQVKVYSDVEVYAKVGSADEVLIPNVLDGTKITIESTNVDVTVMATGDLPIKRYQQPSRVKVSLPVSITSKHIIMQLVSAIQATTPTNAGTPNTGVLKGRGTLSCTPVVTLYIYPLSVDCATGTAYLADASNPDAWKIDVFATNMIEHVYNNSAQKQFTLEFDGTRDADGFTFVHGAGIANPSV
jgi:hypothetical protein